MKKIFYLTVFILLLSTFAACDKDDNSIKRVTNFDVPELTDSNTIQFTVNTIENDYAYIILNGGKIAVDWGDGTVTKDVNPGSGEALRVEFTHLYRTSGEYRVKIWADEVTFINVSALLKTYSRLHVGNCPLLKDANLNSFPNETLNLNGCKNLETLNLGNWKQLKSVTLSECTRLNNIQLYTNPALSALDVSNNAELQTLNCSDCGIEELHLHKNVINVSCIRCNLKSVSLDNYEKLHTFDCEGNNELTSLNFTDCDELSVVRFSNTKVESFDFSKFPALASINCSKSKLTNVDVSGNKQLNSLQCDSLALTSLDIANNTGLRILHCSNNNLTTLNVSENIALKQLFINGNQFDKAGLESIFNALPEFNANAGKRDMLPVPQPFEIKIFDNPGTADCDTKIITDKGWVIING